MRLAPPRGALTGGPSAAIRDFDVRAPGRQRRVAESMGSAVADGDAGGRKQKSLIPETLGLLRCSVMQLEQSAMVRRNVSIAIWASLSLRLFKNETFGIHTQKGGVSGESRCKAANP